MIIFMIIKYLAPELVPVELDDPEPMGSPYGARSLMGVSM
jgi:hypothetical protein